MKNFAILNRRVISATCVMVLTGLFLFGFTAGDEVVGFTTDDAIYLLMAEIYSPWHRVTDPVLEFVRAQNHFPPFYPVILGLLGADTGHPVLASRISTALLLCGCLITAMWIRQVSGSQVIGLVLGVLTAILPGTLVLSQGLWSEFLFIALLYGIFLVLDRDELRPQHWLAGALLVALLTLTRTAGLAMVPAFAVLLAAGHPRHRGLLGCISIVPLFLWLLLNSGTDQGDSYLGTLAGVFTGLDPASLPAAIVDKCRVIYASVYWLLSGDENPAAAPLIYRVVPALLLLAALPVLFTRLFRQRPDAVFLPVYLLMVMVWPFSQVYYVSRFLFPLLPLLLCYAWLGCGLLLKNRTTAVIAGGIIVLLAVLPALPNFIHFTSLAYSTVGDDLDPYRRHRSWLYSRDLDEAARIADYTRDLIKSLRGVAAVVPENECVYAIHPGLVMLHAHRVTGALPDPGVSAQTFARETSSCRYIIAMKLSDNTGTYPEYYPVLRLRDIPGLYSTPVPPPDDPSARPLVFVISRPP